MKHEKTIDYSWEHEINPDNIPWKPGYKFCVRQESKTHRRGFTTMRARRYYVQFRITREGQLEWCGGVKATPDTFARVQALYQFGLKAR